MFCLLFSFIYLYFILLLLFLLYTTYSCKKRTQSENGKVYYHHYDHHTNNIIIYIYDVHKNLRQMICFICQEFIISYVCRINLDVEESNIWIRTLCTNAFKEFILFSMSDTNTHISKIKTDVTKRRKVPQNKLLYSMRITIHILNYNVYKVGDQKFGFDSFDPFLSFFSYQISWVNKFIIE